MTSMVLRALASTLLVATAAPSTAEPAATWNYRADFDKRLRLLADLRADPCQSAPGGLDSQDSDLNQFTLFADASHVVTDALNAKEGSESPHDRAVTALQGLQDTSATLNAAWPAESRFRYRVLEVGPVLLVQMSIRTYDGFQAFALTDFGDGHGSLWQHIGSDERTDTQRSSSTSLQIYPLSSGASGHARFLTQFLLSGCAGSYSIQYDAWEWDPDKGVGLERILQQIGSFGLDDQVPGFEQIGSLRTEGPRITLPYCWFSGIDTWDNPSLCAVDTYDLSGKEVRFVSRTVNRPDLLPVAKAIEYAQKREYETVRAYCDSDAVARKLVRELPPDIFAGTDVKVARRGRHKEQVELGDDAVYRFDLVERAGRWVVSDFRAE